MKKEDTEKKPVQPNRLLRQARLSKGFSQREVADLLGLPDTRSIRRWEGGIHLPRSYYRRKLAEVFGKSLEELGFGGFSDKAESQDEGGSSSDGRANTLPDPGMAHNTGNIAPWFTSFIGRTAEIAKIRALFARPDVRLVTILGPGGVGKTRLAVELARAGQADFPHGICQISLAAVQDPTLLFPTITKELQLQEEGQGTFIANLQEFFAYKQFLLILDNVEYILPDGAILIEELLGACPSLKVLATSQRVLHLSSEHEFALDPFPVPEQHTSPEDLLHFFAVQLFIQRAQMHKGDFEVTPENVQMVSKICACLDGLPLAIELAATRVKLLGLSTLLQELLQRPLPVLHSDIKTPFPRHQTLTDTIAWSYHRLDEREQWFFRRLALFPGGCSLQAAKELNQIAPFPTTEVLDVLMSLLDKNMIRPGVQRGDASFFSMLETIREYGMTLLQQLGEWETARQVQADYYLAVLAEAESSLKGLQQGFWLARLDNERENLRAVLTWLIERHESEQALSFCEVFGKYCGLRGYWGEELHWLEAVLALPEAQQATKLRGRVLRRTGYILYRFRDLERALTLFAESATLSEALGDRSNLAGAFNGLAWVYYRSDQLALAKSFFLQSVEVARTAEDNWVLANALESLGRFAFTQGHVQEAAAYVEESISLARTIEDRESLVRQLSAFVPIKLAQGLFEEAEALAREGFSYALALENKPLIGIALTGLADTAFAQQNLASARDLYERLVRLANEMDDKPTAAHIKLNLSKIALQENNLAQAALLAQESLTFFQQRGDKPNIASATSTLREIRRFLPPGGKPER